MTPADTALDPHALREARDLLRRPRARESMAPTLGAAAFAAASALLLAAAMITAPPLVTQSAVRTAAP